MIGKDKTEIWNRLTAAIDNLYDMDRNWNKGFGDRVYEYKYRSIDDILNMLKIKRKPNRK